MKKKYNYTVLKNSPLVEELISIEDRTALFEGNSTDFISYVTKLKQAFDEGYIHVDKNLKAMFANGYKEELKEDLYDELEDPDSIAYHYYNNPNELYDDVKDGTVDISHGAISDWSLEQIINKANYTKKQIKFLWDCTGHWNESLNEDNDSEDVFKESKIKAYTEAVAKILRGEVKSVDRFQGIIDLGTVHEIYPIGYNQPMSWSERVKQSKPKYGIPDYLDDSLEEYGFRKQGTRYILKRYNKTSNKTFDVVVKLLKNGSNFDSYMHAQVTIANIKDKKPTNESLKEANDRMLKPGDFYFANEKPGEKKKIEVSATKLQSLDKEDLESILENAGNGSLIHNIYDTYWLQKNLRDGKTPTESTVEKSTQVAQNYYAPVPTKYYEEVWKVSGSTKSIYDLIKIIKGKSKYYMVSSNPSLEEVTKHREFFGESLIESLDESFTEHEKDIIYQALATYDKEYADMDANERDDFDNIHDDIKELLKKVSIMECIKEAYGDVLPDNEDSDFYLANGNYYKEIASKTVKDFDGFVTDYTLYMKVDSSKTSDSVSFVTVFGDKDLYRPEDGYYDFECETPQEALEWFRNYNTDEDDIDESLTESAHFDYYDQKVKKAGYTEDQIAKVISIADDYESKAEDGVITYDQMDEVASQMDLEEMSDSELRRAWDMYYDILSRESFKDDDTSDNLDNYKKYSDACSAFAEVINREARRRKEAGNYNPDNESLKEAALNPNFDKKKYGRFFDENNHLIPELAKEYFDLVHQEQKAQYDFSSKSKDSDNYNPDTNESLKERYSSDQVILPAALRKKLNNLCYKYSGFKLPEEVAPLWDELYDLGIEVLIQGPPQDVAADGAKSWTVPFQYNGETVDNSRFVYSVYEGSNSLKNDYNMYFS